ncbi:hypothetical protein GCK32_007650 [Trichostrongylus colubriformis]|uniref:Uncharacterized protein n=1 Tax=Trichostrongylus colubriformis TaxID=6319 RepID=A0AAN8IUV4_TRICO
MAAIFIVFMLTITYVDGYARNQDPTTVAPTIKPTTTTQQEKPKDKPVVEDTGTDDLRAPTFCGSNPENAKEELETARTNLKKLSSPEKYKTVRNKISSLLRKESKDWKKADFRNVLERFSRSLSRDQVVREGDFNAAIVVLETRIEDFPNLPYPKTPEGKLKYLAELIQTQADVFKFYDD